MAVDKGVLLTAINNRFKGKSLSKTYKEKLANVWADKIDNDTEIEAYLESMEPVILATESEANSRVTEAIKKLNDKTPAGGKEPEGKPEDKIDESALDPVQKLMLERLNQVTNQLETFTTQSQQQTLQQRFTADERLKGIHPTLLKGRIPQTEDAYESTIEEILTDYQALSKDLKFEALGKDRPAGPAGGAGGGEEEVAPEIKQYVDKLSKS